MFHEISLYGPGKHQIDGDVEIINQLYILDCELLLTTEALIISVAFRTSSYKTYH